MFFQVDIFKAIKEVVKKTFPPKIKKATVYSLKKKKLLARQEELKRDVQNKNRNN